MNKILIKVFVPSISASYEMFIPVQVPIYKVLELMKKVITDLSAGLFVANESTILCNKEDGKVLNINLSAIELDIKNGSKLMII